MTYTAIDVRCTLNLFTLASAQEHHTRAARAYKKHPTLNNRLVLLSAERELSSAQATLAAHGLTVKVRS